jgi:glutamate 5-kinase
MLELVKQMADLRAREHQMLLVSSAAIFAGREMLGPPRRRRDIPFKQTLAAVGQVRLVGLYEQFFALYDTLIAQALLTRADLADRGRYLNARNTLLSLLQLRVIPIINENDVVAIDEIKIGDNDNLSALVANLVDADWLIMLTDQAGLFTADPRTNSHAQLIPEVGSIDETIRQLAVGSGSAIGTGGMTTKIEAAELATRSGTNVVIACGTEPDVLLRLVSGETLGTRFPATVSHIESRKRWILAEPAQGTVQVDEGAAQALVQQGKSLLAVGVISVSGHFERGQTVQLLNSDGYEIARGITNYNASDLAVIKGHRSDQIPTILGYQYGPTVVHRDDLVLV